MGLANDERRGKSLQRVILLGYMCSGKSTVGEALARRLNWQFLDFDVEIERREGVSISNIIDSRGESYFRSLEAALTDEISREREIVVAPGGGWITQPQLLESIRPGTLSAWLRVSPEETVRRLKEDSIDRPFKDLEHPEEKISRMIEEREPLYRRADLMIAASMRSVEELAFELEFLVRYRTGRPGVE
ncbi:shikimate kinase [soil metagenome]